MNYLDKISLLRDFDVNVLYKNEIFFLDIPEKGVQKEFIVHLKERWEFLSEPYADFLLMFNGGQYDDISFLGDEKCKNGDIFSVANNFELFFKEIIPIATDSAGDFFCLNKNGAVCWVILDNIYSNDGSPVVISDTFEKFMNDFCFGTLYETHYGKNSWTDFVTSVDS